MKLRVIGTGSQGNSYVLNHGCDTLLLDAGVPVKHIYNAIGYNMEILDGVLFSHGHLDHIKSAKALVNAYVETVMPHETAAQLGLTDAYYPQLHTGTEKITLGNWIIKPYPLEHDTANNGYLIYSTDTKQKIMYATDSGYIRSAPTGINIMIIECNYISDLLNTDDDTFSRVKSGHMSLERLVSYLKKIDITQLTHVVLIHLSDRNSDEKRMVDTIADVTGVTVYAANNGLCFDLDEIPF